MKKIITALLCAALVAVTASGCGYSDPLIDANSSATEASKSNESEATADEINEASYKNDLSGIINYFIAKGYIDKDNKNITKMDAKSIGAKAGKKYICSYEGKNISIELYEYDTAKLSDTAKDIIDSVNKNGKFSIFELPEVPADMSDNGRFMLIYTDKSIDKNNPDKTTNNYKHREEVIKSFKAFHKNDK